ncbi:MAG: hypothetical protein KatS3mg124_1482 [Porticoccaceae bacterium]|nr:MAG: hypothetical protein KatS3mg124_1482 [Porticoccaceae bacterium]
MDHPAVDGKRGLQVGEAGACRPALGPSARQAGEAGRFAIGPLDVERGQVELAGGELACAVEMGEQRFAGEARGPPRHLGRQPPLEPRRAGEVARRLGQVEGLHGQLEIDRRFLGDQLGAGAALQGAAEDRKPQRRQRQGGALLVGDELHRCKGQRAHPQLIQGEAHSGGAVEGGEGGQGSEGWRTILGLLGGWVAVEEPVAVQIEPSPLELHLQGGGPAEVHPARGREASVVELHRQALDVQGLPGAGGGQLEAEVAAGLGVGEAGLRHDLGESAGEVAGRLEGQGVAWRGCGGEHVQASRRRETGGPEPFQGHPSPGGGEIPLPGQTGLHGIWQQPPKAQFDAGSGQLGLRLAPLELAGERHLEGGAAAEAAKTAGGRGRGPVRPGAGYRGALLPVGGWNRRLRRCPAARR